MRLYLSLETLRRSKKGTISGQVWLDFEEGTFPEKNWSDIAVAVVLAFLSATEKIISGRSDSEMVYFLDGPFYVQITRSAADRLEFHTFARQQSSHVVLADLQDWVTSVRSTAQELLRFCAAQGWDDADIAGLRTIFER